MNESDIPTQNTIISSNEGIAVFILQLTVHILFRLFQSDVHIAIQTRKHTYACTCKVDLSSLQRESLF